MDEQQVDITALQDEYFEAEVSKDQDRIAKAKEAIENVLSGKSPDLEVKEASGSVEEVQSPIAKDGDPPVVEPVVENKGSWLDTLTDPAIKAEVEKLLKEKEKEKEELHHAFQSVNGRVAAFQRRYEEEKKLRLSQEERLRSSSPTAQPQHSSAAPKKPLSINDDPDLKAIAETDEQLAKVIYSREQAMREEMEELRKELHGVKDAFAPVRQYQEQQHQNHELSRLTQIIPNAIDIFTYIDPETKVNPWDDWVKRQPRAIREAALSDDAEEVAGALKLHIYEMREMLGFNRTEESADVTTTHTQEVNPKLEAVQRERERKLQATPVGSASVRPPQKTQPTMAEILANPDLLREFQDKIYKDEMKKKGYDIT